MQSEVGTKREVNVLKTVVSGCRNTEEKLLYNLAHLTPLFCHNNLAGEEHCINYLKLFFLGM